MANFWYAAMREECAYSRRLQSSHNRVLLEEVCVDFGILVDFHFLRSVSIEIYISIDNEHTILKVLSSSLIC